MGVGRQGGLRRGLDLRPHPVGRDAGRAVARGGAGIGRRGRGDAAHPPGHARRDPELPPPGHAGPGGHRPRRRERRPPRPRGGSGERRVRRLGPRSGALDAGGAPGALRGVPAGAARHHRRGADRPHDHADGALRGRRGAQHAGHAAAPPAPDRRRRRAEGAAAGRRPRAPLGDHRSHRTRRAHAGGLPGGRAAAAPGPPGGLPVGGPGAGEHRQGAAVDPDRARCSTRRPSSTNWSPPTSSWASTNSCSTTQRRPARTVAVSRSSSGSPSVTPRAEAVHLRRTGGTTRPGTRPGTRPVAPAGASYAGRVPEPAPPRSSSVP